ncbi:MAG: TonB-dependent receptor [Bacteroidota bacterium]|nr:TonB-dependent receptor [Bacteroidota bacterium]
MKNKFRKKSITFLLVFGSITIFAQTKYTIEGRVIDENQKPLPYVNVFILNTADGSMSGDDGTFTFTTTQKGNVTLVASMIGYKNFTKEIALSSKKITVEIELEESIVNLKEVIVAASSYGSEKEKGLVISRIDVLTTPGGAADIFQALKTMPGLTQVSESAELYVRGGDPIETITIIDQAVVYHPFTFESAYGGLFSNLNQSVIKSMYFTSGGFSAKYGNALSGVLDIETKNQPERTRYNFGLSLANASLTADIPFIENKFGMYFDLRQSFTKPLFWLNGGLDCFTATPESKNATGGIVYSYSKTGRIKLFGIFADDKQGVNVERAEFNGIFDGNSKNIFVNLQNTDILFNNLIMKNSIAYNKYSNSWLLGILDLKKTDNVYSFRNDFEFILNSSSKLLSGFEYEKRKADYDGKIPEEDFDIRPEAQAKIIDATFNGTRYGTYGEYQAINIIGINNLSFAGGVRYDNIPELNLSWIDPRASFGYKLGGESNLRFGWGIFHQLPDPRLFRPEDGNPNLKSMKATHYILSYDYQLDDQNSFRIEVYRKDYSDLPLEQPVISYDNSGNGFANGIDVIFKGTLPLGITGWISYGYINTKRIWMDYEKLTSSSFDITHNLSLIMKYNLSEIWQIGMNAKYATGRPYTPIESAIFREQLKIYEPVYAETNSARFPDYTRVDLRVTYLGQLYDRFPIVVYLEGLNILNFTNIFGYSYSPDYKERKEIKSYFGNRMVVVGFTFGI